MGNIGLQLFSVSEEAEANLLQTVEKVAAMGYEGVEFAGFFNTPAAELRKTMDNHGIKAAGAHIGIEKLEDPGELEKTFAYQKEINNDLIICPALPKEKRKNIDDYKRIAELLNQVGDTCQRHGFTFGYHNHGFEFEEIEGQTGFQIIFNETDPKLVKMELDCGWAEHTGANSVDIIRKYSDRLIALHIKDLNLDAGYKLSTEIGRGGLNIPSIISEGKKAGVTWFTVEQEDFDKSPMETAQINVNNLNYIL